LTLEGFTPDFPTSFDQVGAWSKQRGVGASEARRRFAQYAVLRAIASSARLGEILVFKGGNALDFVWSPNRSTLDLDFSADMARLGGHTLAGLEAELADLFSRALPALGRDLGITMRVHGVRRQPPGEGKTFITYTVRVGYALPDEARNRTRLEAGQPSTNVVPVEVSINEPIGADERLPLGDGTRSLRVGTPDDIIAEKLRAFLQQKETIRNRNRPQDLLDVAHVLRRSISLDLAKVSRFLLEKARARNVPVSKAAFRDAELAERARHGYDDLESTVREDFVPFEEALEALYGLVERLEIAEH
jgi:predicted nucleotidyltransferase component of viral defense system